MKFLTLLAVLVLSMNTHASALFGTIKKIEMQLSQGLADSSLENIQSLENGLKIEGVYSEYNDITDSLKAIAYMQKSDFSNALVFAEQAIDTMSSRPYGDPLVDKYFKKIAKLRDLLKNKYPFADFEKYADYQNKFLYKETKNNKLYKKYDSFFTIDQSASTKCSLSITKFKSNYSYTSKNTGKLTKASHYWKYKYQVDFSRLQYVELYNYNRTNNIRFMRLSYSKTPKNASTGIKRTRYKMKASNDSTMDEKKTFESYIDIEIGNDQTENSRINEIEETFKKRHAECNKNFANSSKPKTSSNYKETLAKINKITNQKVSKGKDSYLVTAHSKVLYRPYKNKCGGTFEIIEIEKWHADKKTRYGHYQTEITNPSAMEVTFDRQRFYRNGPHSNYKKNGKALDWVFYGWIKNKDRKFKTMKMYYLHDNGSKENVQFSHDNDNSENIDYMTDPGYYQVRDLLKTFFKQIRC